MKDWNPFDEYVKDWNPFDEYVKDWSPVSRCPGCHSCFYYCSCCGGGWEDCPYTRLGLPG